MRKMEIKDLQPRQGNVEIELEVTEKGDIREFEKFGNKGRVCNAKGKDGTGEIVITLWNDDIDKINAGDKVKFSNAYVSEWQGEMQLSTGKFGKMEVLEKSEKTPEKKEEAEEKGEEEISVDEESFE